MAASLPASGNNKGRTQSGSPSAGGRVTHTSGADRRRANDVIDVPAEGAVYLEEPRTTREPMHGPGPVRRRDDWRALGGRPRWYELDGAFQRVLITGSEYLDEEERRVCAMLRYTLELRRKRVWRRPLRDWGSLKPERFEQHFRVEQKKERFARQAYYRGTGKAHADRREDEFHAHAGSPVVAAAAVAAPGDGEHVRKGSLPGSPSRLSNGGNPAPA